MIGLPKNSVIWIISAIAFGTAGAIFTFCGTDPQGAILAKLLLSIAYLCVYVAVITIVIHKILPWLKENYFLQEKLIDPRKDKDYSSVFNGAREVRAYNPPLNLLTNPSKKSHRDVLKKLLSGGVPWKAICHKDATESHKVIVEHLIREGLPESNVRNLFFSYYEEPHRLHTTVEDFPCKTGPDVRGTSFFLIRKKWEDNVLLYPYGLLSENFQAPKHAIWVRGPRDQNDLYNDLDDVFTKRWDSECLQRDTSSPEPVSDRGIQKILTIINEKFITEKIGKAFILSLGIAEWIRYLLRSFSPEWYEQSSWIPSFSKYGISVPLFVLTIMVLVGPFLKIAIFLTSLLQSGSVSSPVTLVHMSKARKFQDIWKDVVFAYAYNPPLTRLLDDKRYRNTITKLLQSGNFQYQIIVGKRSSENLQKCYHDGWKEDGVDDGTLGNIRVMKLAHEEDLHTCINDWKLDGDGLQQKDIRGLCFFLLEKETGDHEVILYPLGEPFTPIFDVPLYGVRIVIPQTQRDSLYDKLRYRFQVLWTNLREQTDRHAGGLPLPEFIQNYDQEADQKKNGQPTAGNTRS